MVNSQRANDIGVQCLANYMARRANVRSPKGKTLRLEVEVEVEVLEGASAVKVNLVRTQEGPGMEVNPMCVCDVRGTRRKCISLVPSYSALFRNSQEFAKRSSGYDVMPAKSLDLVCILIWAMWKPRNAWVFEHEQKKFDPDLYNCDNGFGFTGARNFMRQIKQAPR